MNDVTICIPVYNKPELTKLCLEQLFSTIPSNRGFDLILCNDASTDTKVNDYLKQIKCRLIEHETNKGFIGSVNDMLREVKTKYLVLMNNDVLVYENWLDKLLEPLEKDEAVGISSLYGHWDEQDNMISATFECAAIRTKILEKLPYLDSRYGQGYYDDEDFCLQAKMLNWKIDYPRLSKLLIEHLGGQTFGAAKEDLLKKNVVIFIKKWYSQSKNSEIVKNHLKYMFNPFKGKQGFSEEEIREIVENKNYVRSLEEIGESLDTDKIIYHGYHRFYPIFLEKYRDKPMTMLEIGTEDNKSIKMWQEYFHFSKIYGIDIFKEFKSDRIEIFKGNQSDLIFLKDIIDKIGAKIDFIIDDGSHKPEDQLKTFCCLFDNLLKEGGVYIIEDIETNYWKEGECYNNLIKKGYKHKESVIEIFKDMIDKLNEDFIKDRSIFGSFAIPINIQDKIGMVSFAYNSIIIIKKDKTYSPFENRKYRFSEYL